LKSSLFENMEWLDQDATDFAQRGKAGARAPKTRFPDAPFARDAEDCSLPSRKRAISALVTSIDVVTTSRSISGFAIEGARALGRGVAKKSD
jgi:hypothetical protein